MSDDAKSTTSADAIASTRERGASLRGMLLKELLVTSRRGRSYVLRAAYLAALAMYVVGVYLSLVPDGTVGSYGSYQMAQLGKSVISSIVFFQMAGATLVAVALASTALHEEINRRTLAALLTTPLSDRQVVVGKLVGRLMQLLSLILLIFPLLGVVRVFGGVDFAYILAGTGLTLCWSALVGAFTMYLSLRFRGPFVTGVVSLGIIAAYCLFSIYLSVCCFAFLGTGILTSLANPFFLITMADRFQSPRGFFLGAIPFHLLWPISCAAMLGLAWLFVHLTSRKLRPVAANRLFGDGQITETPLFETGAHERVLMNLQTSMADMASLQTSLATMAKPRSNLPPTAAVPPPLPVGRSMGVPPMSPTGVSPVARSAGGSVTPDDDAHADSATSLPRPRCMGETPVPRSATPPPLPRSSRLSPDYSAEVPKPTADPWPTRPSKRRVTIRSVRGSPVLWKELHHQLHQRMPTWLALLIMILFAMVYSFCGAAGTITSRVTQAIFIDVLLGATLVALLLTLANTLAGERERRSLTVLMTTPLSDWRILRDKTLGAFLNAWAAWGLLAAHILLFLLLGVLHPAGLALAGLAMLSVIGLHLGAGLWMGSRLKRPAAVLMGNTLLAVALWVGMPGLARVLQRMVPWSGWDVVLGSSPFVQIYVAITGASWNTTPMLDFHWPGGVYDTPAATILAMAGWSALYLTAAAVMLVLAKRNLRRDAE